MKDFIVVGNGNAVMYEDFSTFIKNRKVFVKQTSVEFTNGVKLGNVSWYNTILPVKTKPLILTKSYDPACYPKYDNYDAIESRTNDIPYDYDGVIGVPISFLDRWDPEQFEVINISNRKGFPMPRINGKNTFARILIKRRI